MTPGPIVSAQWLADNLGDPRWLLADVRWSLGDPGAGRAEYLAGHIPGAVFVDWTSDLSDTTGPGRHPLPSPERFAERMGALGIGDDTLSRGIRRHLGFGGGPAVVDAAQPGTSVAVLDGGWQAWVDLGCPWRRWSRAERRRVLGPGAVERNG